MVQTTTSVTSAIRPIQCSFERVNTMESGKYKHGATLVEILVVVAVIMVLAGLIAGIGMAIDSHSKEKAVKGTFSLIEAALQEYYDFTDTFPEPNVSENTIARRSEMLYRELHRIPGSREVLGKISDKVIKDKVRPDVYSIYDPWGTVLDYRYNSSAGDSFPKLISAGPDKAFRNGDDITNR